MPFPALVSPLRQVSGVCLLAVSGFLWLLVSAPLRAQSFDATSLREPTDVGGVWLVKTGDDPSFARADLDDSQWTRVDTTQTLKKYFPDVRNSVVWYRLHVKVAPNETGLALEEYNLSSAFEIYVNGERVFVNGSVSPYRPYTAAARIVRRIPDSMIASGSLVIAMRLYVSANDWVNGFPGFFPYNLVIGQETELSDHVWLTTIGDHILEWFYQFAGLGLGIIALALFAAQRQQRGYLLIFLLFLIAALPAPLRFYGLFHNLPASSAYIGGIFQILNLVILTLMFLAFLHMPLKRWLQVMLAISAAGILFGSWQTANGVGSSIGTLISQAPELSVIAGIIPVLLIVHWRRGNQEAGILLVPALVNGLIVYIQLGIFLVITVPALAGTAFRFQQAVFTWTAGPFTINISGLAGCIFVLSLAVILVLRSARVARQQAHLESEMAAASEVQKIILPEQMVRVPGFSVETAYVPDQQVGGDFFQILPAPENSLLLVVGDVAGKGLPAAMMVSVLVGAVRGVAEYTSEPSELLANLNQRLTGRAGGSLATALAARLFPDGSVDLANAGHLAPYLDGCEVEIPGALPLGAKSGTRYETVRFVLPRGSRLTFYSDGIVEAKNPRGELFGFERGREISTKPVVAIVDAAKQFGQKDDMTVIAVTREAAGAQDAVRAQRMASGAPAMAD